MSLYKYKYKLFFISIFVIILMSILYLIDNSCGIKKLFYSSKVLGFYSTIEDCKFNFINKANNKLDLIFLKLNTVKMKKNFFEKNSNYIHFPKKFINTLDSVSNFSEDEKKNDFFISGEINNLDKHLLKKNKKKIKLEWLRSNGGNENLKYSENGEINQNTVDKLRMIWKFKPKKFNTVKDWKYNVEVNPVFFNKKIFLVTANNQIYSLDAKNGKVVWSIKPVAQISRRGLVIDKIEKDKGYLYLPLGNKIYKIDSETGKINKEFGTNGYIKFNYLKKNHKLKTLTAPVIYNDYLCFSLLTNISCVDKVSGKKEFDISVHPSKKDFKYGGVIWGGIALDEDKGILYVVTGNPRNALIGYNRIGNNKNSNSIVALDLNQRKILWTFQDVMHDLWDYDVAHPPIIHDIKFENKIYPSVIIVGKTGNVHIINRFTGKHLHNINYKRAPKSEIPGEVTSRFQLFLKKPERLFKIEGLKEKVINSNSKKKDILLRKLNENNYGWFQPPSFGKKLITLGLHGGASWTGSSVNIDNDLLFTPINLSAFQIKVEGRTHSENIDNLNNSFLKIYKDTCSSCHGKFRNGTLKVKKIGEKLVNYVPGLIGHSIFMKKNDYENFFDYEKIKKKHEDNFIEKDKYLQLLELFETWDEKIINNNNLYLYSHWSKYLDKNGEELLPPPYGKVVATDLKTGKIIWDKKIGKINKKTEGTVINGGLVSNKGNILIVTGTPDGYVYLLNQQNGEILWKYEMESAGSSPPIFFQIDGKQFFSIISSGGLFHEYKKKSSTLYTFAIN